MYAEGHKREKRQNCRSTCSMRCAISRGQISARSLGSEFSAAYLKLKTNEWNNYCRHLTQWERRHTLDC